MPEKRDNLLIWGSDIEEGTILQAAKTSRLPFLGGHVALMPDAHVGIGSTVGSVIPTVGAIIPAAIGVDIGCGMCAVKLDLTASQLPDDLEGYMPYVERAVPAGVGKGHEYDRDINIKERIGDPFTDLNTKQRTKAISQCGTLGSGNHFFEVCLDEHDGVWIVLHSGSRGIGNELARIHIDGAKKEMKKLFISLEDQDLAYFIQETPEFEAYILDMLWAQEYAFLNREIMLGAAYEAFCKWMGRDVLAEQRINCHHNFTQKEKHFKKEMWITRKGAIKADRGDFGIIPGSMGTRSYIVEGRGNPASYNSCSHGAGRRYSRSKARELFTTEDLNDRMQGKVWNADRAKSLIDEIPDSYKDIDTVMEDQQDLVEVMFTLHQIFNYKG